MYIICRRNVFTFLFLFYEMHIFKCYSCHYMDYKIRRKKKKERLLHNRQRNMHIHKLIKPNFHYSAVLVRPVLPG